MSEHSNISVTIHKDVLQELLKKSGKGIDVEKFLTQEEIAEKNLIADSFKKRAKAAYWSRFWLVLSLIFSLFSLATSYSIEDILTTLLFLGMTIVEFKVYKWFLNGDPRAISWGWHNQCCFALYFLIWGGFHVLFPQTLSKEVTELLNANGAEISAQVTSMMAPINLMFYSCVGVVGALGQFLLANYYRKTLH